MKIKNLFILSNMTIFQATCAFIAGYLLSSQLLHLFACHVGRQRRLTEGGTTILNGHARELHPTEHSDVYRSNDELQSKRHIRDEDEQFFQKPLRIGCFLVYDVATPAKVLYTSWIPQCDVNMTLDTRLTFPNAQAMNSTPFLKELRKYNENEGQLDYYLFAPHDAYIVVDNLREYLSHCDPDQPKAYGHALVNKQEESGTPYYTVGGTLVLSREALLRVTKIQECRTNKLPTTKTILTCLHKSGGNLVDSRDQFAKNTFLAPARPFQILTGSLDKNFVKEQKFSTNYCEGVSCLSDFPIAFHKMSSSEFHLVHFLINWANYSHYTGTNKHSKLRLSFIGSNLPLESLTNIS